MEANKSSFIRQKCAIRLILRPFTLHKTTSCSINSQFRSQSFPFILTASALKTEIVKCQPPPALGERTRLDVYRVPFTASAAKTFFCILVPSARPRHLCTSARTPAHVCLLKSLQRNICCIWHQQAAPHIRRVAVETPTVSRGGGRWGSWVK